VVVPSSYRPLGLLDDDSKIFESLLVIRIDAHMSGTGIELSGIQFGFRSGKSTDDELRLLQQQQQLLVTENARRTAVTVSLDIRNAFNAIGRGVVRATLVRMGIPLYRRRILGSYLSARTLHLCDDGGGVPVTEGVTVLGPLL